MILNDKTSCFALSRAKVRGKKSSPRPSTSPNLLDVERRRSGFFLSPEEVSPTVHLWSANTFETKADKSTFKKDLYA